MLINKINLMNRIIKKRRRDVIYNLNTIGRSPRDDTLKKYNIIFNSSTNKYE